MSEKEARVDVPSQEIGDGLTNYGITDEQCDNYVRVKEAICEIARKVCKRKSPSCEDIRSLIGERDSVSERLRRLKAYIDGPEYDALSPKHQQNVLRQREAMEEYYKCVVLRIGEGLCQPYVKTAEELSNGKTEEEQA